jgi:hypothetical protein
MVSIKTKLELRSERDTDQEETGARSWDAQWRNGKGVLCDEVKPDAGEVKKAAEKEQEEKSEIWDCTPINDFSVDDPFIKSFNLVTNNDMSVIENEGRSAAIPSW